VPRPWQTHLVRAAFTYRNAKISLCAHQLRTLQSVTGTGSTGAFGPFLPLRIGSRCCASARHRRHFGAIAKLHFARTHGRQTKAPDAVASKLHSTKSSDRRAVHGRTARFPKNGHSNRGKPLENSAPARRLGKVHKTLCLIRLHLEIHRWIPSLFRTLARHQQAMAGGDGLRAAGLTGHFQSAPRSTSVQSAK
jgi:hypothetical protein